MIQSFEDAYRRACEVTGLTRAELDVRAREIFASMLIHVIAKPGAAIWSSAILQGTSLVIEVNMPPRRPAITSTEGR